MLESLLGDNLTLLGTLATICTGLATGVGALPILFVRNISDRLLDTMLGFAAGVMLAATAFSLIVPAIELGGVWITVTGILMGAVFLSLLDRFLPHEHLVMGHEGPSSALRRIWLLIIAITLHNFPEGLAVGVSYGGGDIPTATSLAIAIGLQNMPEGLAVALPLGLAFAAAAMLYVVSDEIIPETHRKGFEHEGTWGVMIGFAIMMLLDNLFG